MDQISLAQAVEKGREWGSPAPLAPLILSYDVCETSDNILRNIRQTLETTYQPYMPLIAPPHKRRLSIVGFGPSIKKTWTRLKGDVWATNGAHNWLIERGVIPKYAMFWDAAKVVSGFIRPHKDVTYLIASRCHRSVFEALDGYNVYVWHAVGDAGIEDLLVEYERMEPMLGHGSAAVTTSMLVASNMGYRNMHIFGGDSSYPEGEHTHADKSLVEERPLEIWMDGQRFLSTSWLAGQVEDMRIIGPGLKEQGARLTFHGDGLLQHAAKINGFTVRK